MAEKTKAEIADELRAEYRAAIKRTAADEDALRRSSPLSRGGVKSIRVAFLFWLFLGGFGVHRFYLGRTLSGAAMLALTLCAAFFATQPSLSVISFVPAAAVSVWWLVDAFQIPKMVP